jgi:signal transduction histidine kinase/ligand-binding sensor domain-containing protein/CheY-like chemotaxis protein
MEMPKFIPLLLFLFFAIACDTGSEDKSGKKGGPKPFFTNGKQMNADSLSKPVTCIAGEPLVVPVRPPKVTPYRFNIHAAGNPAVIIAGTPEVNIPGRQLISFPKVKPALGRKVACGIPQMVIAKDAAIKDVNPANFSFYKTLQGLNRNGIYCMVQDKTGNIWLGTSGGGLSRFDGKFFTNFTQKEGLPNVSVSSMLEDHYGNFWLGTDEGGATLFDGRYFTNFDTTYLAGRINSILEDMTGRIWFGTTHGAACYDWHPRDGGKPRFINFTVSEGLAGNEVYCIIQDRTGKIWLGCNGGLSCYDNYSGDDNKNGFINFTTSQGLAADKVKSIVEDKTGNLWFGTDGGLSRYDGNRVEAIEKGEKMLQQDQNDLTRENGKLVKTFTNFTEKEGLSSNKISSILEDQDGNIWLGTDASGLSCYQKSKNGKEGLFINFTEQEGLADNRVTCILKDNANNLLFGTAGGVCIYYGKYFTNFTEKEGLPNSNIFCMLEDNTHKVWFGSYGNGVCCFDGKTFTNFTTKEGLIDDKVYSMLQDRTGKIWIGTGAGVSCYEQHPKDGSQARFLNFTKKEGLVHNQVLEMLEDRTGKLWFCTLNGVSCYEQPAQEGDAGHFTNFTKKEGLAGNTVLSMMEDKTGNLWFGTYEGGMSRYDGKSFTNFTKKEGMPSNVFSMLEDKAGNLWFGTYGGGVLYYDGKSFLNLTTKEGLATDIVQSLLQDKRGNIWLGTSKGLSKISHANVEKLNGNSSNFNRIPEALFYNYEYNDGFIGLSCLRNSVLQDHNERIWWGTDILACYLPQGDEIDTDAPNVQLTGVKLFGQEISWSNAEITAADSISRKPETRFLSDTLANGIVLHHIKYDGTSKWYNVPVNLNLPYDNNTISFNFIGVHMQSRNHIQYQYQLGGLEDYWSNTENSEVSFSNLSPGEYAFKVKAMNQSGRWSKPVEFEFKIAPPWFQTTPAYMLYVLLSAGFIRLVIIYFNAQKLIAEKKKLKILVEERTMEVVTQKNKAEKLLQVKENFLSNMSHEIRTPLNAIIGYTDLSLKETSMAKTYKYLRSIKVSSDHLHHLVNNILDIAKMESGTLTFLETNFDLKETLEEVKHLMHFLSLRRGNVLQIKINNPSSTLVFGDKEKLLQVLLNLIDNAIKFTENGQIDVSVDLVEKENHQLDAFFSVKDTGIGIPENKFQTIFESFTQADNTITRMYGGTGLGLTICKKIIELQGGEITVNSIEKKGACFSFRLPYIMGKKQENQPVNFQPHIALLKGIRVLVAEDDSVNKELLKTILSQWELTTDFAENGEKLIALLMKNTYDLILMDIHMPGMSGVEVATKIRTGLKGCVKDIPIIALTADVLSSTKEKIIGSGINNVLYKPINAENLYLNIVSELGLKTVATFNQDAPHGWEIKTEKINLNYLIESCGQNKDQLLKILSGSFEKLIEYNVSMATAYQEKDFDQLYFIAHKLGSILKILGILELDPRLTQLKESIHTNLGDVEMQDTITYVDAVIKKSTKEIDTIIEFISKN